MTFVQDFEFESSQRKQITAVNPDIKFQRGKGIKKTIKSKTKSHRMTREYHDVMIMA